mmetsp:Transcript_5599/g.14174  ORF Transcript_5599/g.14174 Transcript_5599/m.14174 type:complete len:220 (+) Transcript_5599:1568-2227(+)
MVVHRSESSTMTSPCSVPIQISFVLERYSMLTSLSCPFESSPARFVSCRMWPEEASESVVERLRCEKYSFFTVSQINSDFFVISLELSQLLSSSSVDTSMVSVSPPSKSGADPVTLNGFSLFLLCACSLKLLSMICSMMSNPGRSFGSGAQQRARSSSKWAGRPCGVVGRNAPSMMALVRLLMSGIQSFASGTNLLNRASSLNSSNGNSRESTSYIIMP